MEGWSGEGGVARPVRQRSQGIHELFGGYAAGAGSGEDLADFRQQELVGVDS